MQRVLVTGLGAVTPLGIGAHHSFLGLLAGDNGIASLRNHGSDFQNLPSQVAGLVPRGRSEDGGWTASDWISRDDERHMSTFMHYAVAASEMALADAAWKPKTVEEQCRTGIVLGSGIGSLSTLYNTSLSFSARGLRSVSPFFVPQTLINLAAGHISIRYGLKGPSHAPSTACTTGLHSIVDASMLIATGQADVMLAGSAESCIHPLAIAGFSRSNSLVTSSNHAPERASRPFDTTRDGFVIGEGAGVILLESYDHAKARGLLDRQQKEKYASQGPGPKIYAEVAGWASTSDAHHITSPPPSGEGAFRAMKGAITHAGLSPDQVDYINAHATSTKLGDAAEVNAIKTLLSSAPSSSFSPDKKNSARIATEPPQSPSPLPISTNPPPPVRISSFKGSVGHLLGAAGSVEAIWTLLAMSEGVIPGTRNLESLDPAFQLGHDRQGQKEDEAGLSGRDSGLEFIKINGGGGEEEGLGKKKERGRQQQQQQEEEGRRSRKNVDVALTNSFGFGGTNASICLRRLFSGMNGE